MTRLFLIRHGEVESRYHRVFAGSRIDMDLSPHGKSQADSLAHHFRYVDLHAIYASPMKRAQQTLAPLASNRKFQPKVLRDLHEVDFGDWTGHTWLELRDKFGTNAGDWLDKLEAGAIPNGETAERLRARIDPCLQQILKEADGQQVAVVCHGGIVRMMLAILLQLPLSKMARFEIEYASVTEVHHHPHKTEVQLLNFTPWRALA